MATIYCFTSTGNSLYTAKKLAAQIGGEVRPIQNEPVRCDDDTIGFVFPVYYWGLPRMVARFVSEMQITNESAYLFAVATSGGEPFGALGQLKTLLRKKGRPLRFGARIRSVSNYLIEYEPKDSPELRKKVDERIEETAAAVQNRETCRVQGFLPVNRIAYRFFPGEDSDGGFTVSSACTGCGTCSKVCSAGNITMEAGRPEFRHKCEHCLGCLQNCPAQAIDWKDQTQGKARYRNAGISLRELAAFNSQGNGS